MTIINQNSDFLYSIDKFFMFQAEYFKICDDNINKELKKRNIILHLNPMNSDFIKIEHITMMCANY